MSTEQKQLKESYAYQMGYDCGLNGANTKNCSFEIFSTPQSTKDWERGKQRATIDKTKTTDHANTAKR